MTLWTLLFVVLTALCVLSAGFMWATYYRLHGAVQQNERHINSLRSKVSFEEGKVQDHVDQRLQSVDVGGSSDDSGGMQDMMQMLALMQGMGGQQTPQQTPQQAPQQAPQQTQSEPDADQAGSDLETGLLETVSRLSNEN